MRLLALPASFYRSALNPTQEATPVARERAARLKLIHDINQGGLTIREACRLVGVPKATYYRWRKRVQQHGLLGLNDARAGSRRQRHAPTRAALRPLIETLRQKYAFGKQKLRIILARAGVKASASSIGRVIRELINRGVIRPVGYHGPHARKLRSAAKRAHAKRKHQGMRPTQPGDLVQIDTLQERSDNLTRYHYSAIDPTTRIVHAGLYPSNNSRHAKAFLQDLLHSMPFPITSIQVDNGSEFMGAFERACQELNIQLYTIPPYTPKANAMVERLQRTFRDEHYAYEPPSQNLQERRQALRTYLHHYNHERPHQALNYQTPMQYTATRNPQSPN
jgi:transposase InsO family protein